MNRIPKLEQGANMGLLFDDSTPYHIEVMKYLRWNCKYAGYCLSSMLSLTELILKISAYVYAETSDQVLHMLDI